MKTRLLIILAFLGFWPSFHILAQDVSGTEAVLQLEPEPGKALVYVIRPSKVGYSVEMDVFSNNEYIGSTKGKNYIYFQLDPGETEFRSEGENISVLKLDLEAGSIYYIHQEVHMGSIKARADLHIFNNPEKARRQLTKCKLSKKQMEYP